MQASCHQDERVHVWMVPASVAGWYLTLLVAHVAHIFEEVWGRFWLLGAVGLGWYLTLNALLFALPVALFAFVLQGQRWAYRLAVLYGGVMAAQGAGHLLGAVLSGRYFDGFAGAGTGAALAVLGVGVVRRTGQALHLPFGHPDSAAA